MSTEFETVTMDGVEGYRTKDWCGKMLEQGTMAFGMWKRPTTAHYFSRLMVHCPRCAKKLAGKGATYFFGTLMVDIPCGGWAIPESDSDKPGERFKNMRFHPNYMPIESPRLFGLHNRGGALRETPHDDK